MPRCQVCRVIPKSLLKKLYGDFLGILGKLGPTRQRPLAQHVRGSGELHDPPAPHRMASAGASSGPNLGCLRVRVIAGERPNARNLPRFLKSFGERSEVANDESS
jgi:hypothetical protein